jgi:hypothetical protein
LQFVGNAPTTVQVPSGVHEIVVKSAGESWRRSVKVSAGSTISINASFTKTSAEGHQ